MPVLQVTLVYKPSLNDALEAIFEFIDTAKQYIVRYVFKLPAPQIEYDIFRIVLNGDYKVIQSVLRKVIKIYKNVKIDQVNVGNLLAHYAIIEEDL